MMPLHVTAVEEGAAADLAAYGPWSLHSAFQRVINLHHPRCPRWLTLCTFAARGPGRLHLQVAPGHGHSLDLGQVHRAEQSGMTFSLSADHTTFTFSIDQRVRPYPNPPPRGTLTPEGARRARALLAPPALDPDANGAVSHVDPSIRPWATTLAAALAVPEARLDRAMQALIGRGPGLTPAGDDLLLGLLAAAHLTPLLPLHRRLTTALDACLQPQRTTPFGHQQLLLARQGRFFLDLCQVVQHLDLPPDPTFLQSLDAVRSVGASSGPAILAGVDIALHTFLRCEHLCKA